MPNDKITAVGANIAEKAAMIWNVADMLRGPFKPHEYGLVILPMTVVKRFHDCLLPTHHPRMRCLNRCSASCWKPPNRQKNKSAANLAVCKGQAALFLCRETLLAQSMRPEIEDQAFSGCCSK